MDNPEKKQLWEPDTHRTKGNKAKTKQKTTTEAYKTPAMLTPLCAIYKIYLITLT